MKAVTEDRRRRRLVRHLLVALLVVLWVGAVVYPDPRPFVASIARLQSPPVDPSAVTDLAATLPSDYRAIENFSLDYVTYESAWTIYGLPWYFPNMKEVLQAHAGDCQARALLIASIFEAKGMPYTLNYSFEHVWVDYPGKTPPSMEDTARAFVSDSGGGWLARLPKKIPLWDIIRVRVDYHWSPMPPLQKALILGGALLIVGWGERQAWRRLGAGLWALFRRRAPAA